jgi:hypothetical protein
LAANNATVATALQVDQVMLCLLVDLQGNRLPLSSKASSVISKAWKKKPVNADFDPPEHTCYFNHDGSSGVMEPIACLELTIDAVASNSTRSLLKWSNADYMKNNNTNTPPLVANTKGKNPGQPHVCPNQG